MLAPWKKAMTNLDSILKSRDITLPTKVHIAKVVIFPVVMFGCESWTTKAAECRRVLMLLNCVREDSWESLELQGSNESILKEINPEYSLGGLILKLCEEPTHWKRPWCWVRLKAKGEGAAEIEWLGSITNSMNMNLSKLGDSGGQGSLVCCSPWGCKELDVT